MEEAPIGKVEDRKVNIKINDNTEGEYEREKESIEKGKNYISMNPQIRVL